MLVRHREVPASRYEEKGERRQKGGQLWEFDSPGDLAEAEVKNPGRRGAERGQAWHDRWKYGDIITTEEGNRAALRAGRVPESIYSAYLKAREACEGMVVEAGRVGNTTRRRRRYSDEGDELNVDRMMLGDPLMWERRRRGAKKRVIRIGVRFGGYSWADGEDKFIAGAAAGCAMADALNVMGYETEIIGFCTEEVFSGDRPEVFGQEWVCSVRLKASEEPLDVQRVLTSGLTAMSRAFWFGYEEHNLGMGPTVNGYVRELSSAMREELGLDLLVQEDLGGAPPPDVPDDLWNQMSDVMGGALAAARDAARDGLGGNADDEMEGAKSALDGADGLDEGGFDGGGGDEGDEEKGAADGSEAGLGSDLDEDGGDDGDGFEEDEDGEDGDGFREDQDGEDLGPEIGDDYEPPGDAETPPPPPPPHDHEVDWVAMYGGPPGWAGIA